MLVRSLNDGLKPHECRNKLAKEQFSCTPARTVPQLIAVSYYIQVKQAVGSLKQYPALSFCFSTVYERGICEPPSFAEMRISDKGTYSDVNMHCDT